MKWLLPIIPFLLFVGFNFQYTMDDAFISFRYAENLLAGDLTWNMYGAAVQGYTSYLWVVVLSMLFFISSDLGIIKIFTILCALGVAGVWANIAYKETQNRMLAVWITLPILWMAGTPTHAVSGMETILATLLVSLFVYTLLYAPDEIAGTVGLMLGLTRPEFHLFVLVGLLTSKKFRGLFPWLVGTGLFYLWAYMKYGDPFPIPFYIKAVGHGKIIPGTKDVIITLATILPLLLWIDYKKYWRILFGVVVMLLFFMRVSHIMNVAFRFEYPLLPVLTGLGVLGLYYRRPSKITIAVVKFSFFMINGSLLVKFTEENKQYAEYLETNHITIGHSLLDAKSIAVSDAGAIPYYSKAPTIDMFGLNDTGIYKQTDRVQYILHQHPEFIILISDSGKFHSPLEYENQLYKQMQDYKLGYKTSHLWLFMYDPD